MIATGSDPWPALNTPYVFNTNGQVPSSEIKLLHASRLTNYTGSPDLIHYQRLPRLSLTPQPLQGSWDTILTMQFYSQDNTLFIANPVWLTPIHINFIVMVPIHIRLISPFILFFYLGGLGAPTLPCCPVQVGWPHLLAPPTICWHCRLEVLSALTALSATFLASLSTMTKSGLALLMMVSCCIALWTPNMKHI